MCAGVRLRRHSEGAVLRLRHSRGRRHLRQKNLARHLRRAKSREKCRKSFAASKTYNNSTRQVVAIHTQRCENSQ